MSKLIGRNSCRGIQTPVESIFTFNDVHFLVEATFPTTRARPAPFRRLNRLDASFQHHAGLCLTDKHWTAKRMSVVFFRVARLKARRFCKRSGVFNQSPACV